MFDRFHCPFTPFDRISLSQPEEANQKSGIILLQFLRSGADSGWLSKHTRCILQQHHLSDQKLSLLHFRHPHLRDCRISKYLDDSDEHPPNKQTASLCQGLSFVPSLLISHLLAFLRIRIGIDFHLALVPHQEKHQAASVLMDLQSNLSKLIILLSCFAGKLTPVDSIFSYASDRCTVGGPLHTHSLVQTKIIAKEVEEGPTFNIRP